MRILINERLSEHKYKTPEGYLICTDAIIARTGKQEYRKNEIFADSDDDSIIELDRPADEVFSEKTIASFENKPLVNEHPDEDVNTENYKDYAVGFIRDVHKGTVNGQDVLLANLVFTDKEAIEDIESGRKNELSCGYDCDIVDEKNPKQTNIRGNHVALCERGRAGIAKIVDSVNDTLVKDWSMKYLGHTIEEVFFGYNDDGHYCVDGNKDKRHCFETLEEAKAYIRSLRKRDFVKDNSIFYKAYVDGKVYFSYDREELEKMNPEKIYVLEKDGDIIKDAFIKKQDSIQDVTPRSGESKEDFISRFMSETKEEYPDEKQRLAVAYSYWKKGKGTDSMINDTYYIAKVLGTEDYALEGGIELGMKKYARKFNSENEAYSFMRKYFRVGRNDVIVEKVQDSTYDETPYEKQTEELEKSEERFEDGGFQEIGDFWRNLARKNNISSQQMDDIYVKFMKTPVFQSWSNKDRMDIAYSERMFGEFEKFFKQKTGKDLIVDSFKDAWVKTYRNYSYWPDEEEANLYHVEKRENGRLIKSFTLKASTYNEALQQIKSFKDSLSYSDIDVIEDAIYWVKKSGKDLTVKNVLKQIEEDMSGFIGSNKNDIINYLKKEKHLRDASSDDTTNDAMNGKLSEFNPKEFINKIQQRKQALYTERDVNGKTYTIHVDIDELFYDKNPETVYIDVYDENHKRKTYTAKSWDEAVRVLENVKRDLLRTNDSINDAQTYVIKYKLLEYNMITKREFNANSVEEVLKKFARQIGAQGIGTYNVFVVNISPNDGYVSLYGRLSKLLDEFNIKWYDSVKDSKHIKAIKAIKAIKQHQDSKVKDDYSGFLGNYGFGYLKGSGDYEYWYYKDKNDTNTFNKVVERIRKEYPSFIVSSIKSDDNPRIYIQKSKYGVKDSIVKDYTGKLAKAVPEIVKYLRASKSNIENHAKFLVKNKNYKDFTTRILYDVFYKIKNSGFDLDKYYDNPEDAKDIYIASMMKQAFKEAGISYDEKDYQIKDSKVKDEIMTINVDLTNTKVSKYDIFYTLTKSLNNRVKLKKISEGKYILTGEKDDLKYFFYCLNLDSSKYIKDSKVKDDKGNVEIINGIKYASSPRGKVKISTLKRSDAEKQGYGYHHTIFTAEGRYDVMIKNNSAIAVINEE